MGDAVKLGHARREDSAVDCGMSRGRWGVDNSRLGEAHHTMFGLILVSRVLLILRGLSYDVWDRARAACPVHVPPMDASAVGGKSAKRVTKGHLLIVCS
jgi:hypothetical protein